VRIEMKDAAGRSMFGAIEQTVAPQGALLQTETSVR